MILPSDEPRMVAALVWVLVFGCSSTVVVDKDITGHGISDERGGETSIFELPPAFDEVGDRSTSQPDAGLLEDRASPLPEVASEVAEIGQELPLPDTVEEPDLGTPELPCAPLSCAEAGANCGAADDGCGGTLDCGPCCGNNCTLVVEDPLSGSTVGQQQGGQFVDGGWKTKKIDHRIVYNFDAIDCGYVEVDLTNFNPPEQYDHKTENYDCDAENTDCYAHILGLYQGSHGSQHKAANQGESQSAVQATGPETSDRPKKLKLKGSTCGWGGGGTNYTPKYNWNVNKTYKLRLTWTSGKVTLKIDGEQKAQVALTWPGEGDFNPDPELCPAGDPHLAFTHFFLGRDKSPGGGYFIGPTWSNLHIYNCGE